MKKPLFLALVGLLLSMSWTQPAGAALNKVLIKNHTASVVVVDVHYAVCKSDLNVRVAPNTQTEVHAGLCAVKEVRARIGHTQCTPWTGLGRTFTVSGDTKSCKVT